MSGIRLQTLLEAHGALMAAWDMDYMRTPPLDVRRRCMVAAVALQAELGELMPQIEVLAGAKETA